MTKHKELKILDLGLGVDRRRTKIEEDKLNECRILFRQGKLTIEEGHKIMDKLRIKEDKRLKFKLQMHSQKDNIT